MSGFDRNIKLTLEYDGGAFYGWQIQLHQRSIQETIQDILRIILSEEIKLICAGRTDTGVHALGQVANFHTTHTISLPKLQMALNAHLRPSIAVLKVEEVHPDFHSRFDAKLRTYEYRLLLCNHHRVFDYSHAYQYCFPIDVEAMIKASHYIIGTHDFTTFNASPLVTYNPIRTITELSIFPREELLIIEISANAFLHHMVRSIVGTLLEIGRGKIEYTAMADILASRDRRKCGFTVPPHGLFLKKVTYSS